MIFENGMSYLEELIVFSNDIDYSENAWLYTLLVLLAYAKRALGGAHLVDFLFCPSSCEQISPQPGKAATKQTRFVCLAAAFCVNGKVISSERI